MIKEIAERHSVRKFKDIPVEREKLTEMLHAAMRAPSSLNCQCWRFIVVDKPEYIQDIQRISGKEMFKTAKACMVVLAQERQKDHDEMYVDTAAAIENMLLEAVELGLGACWTVIAPKQDRIEKYREYFRIDEEYLPMALIAIGYSAQEECPRAERFDSEKVTWYRSGSCREEAVI